MKIPTSLILSMLCSILYAQPTESYAVTVREDTIYLYKDVQIDIHAHPQAVIYKNEQLERQKIECSDLQSLSIVQVNQRKNKISTHSYLVKKIITKKGFCTHFVSIFYSQGDFKIWETPYCPNESYLTLYVENEEGDLVSINASNYKQIIDNHFWEYVSFLKLKRRAYNAGKLWQAIADLKESNL